MTIAIGVDGVSSAIPGAHELSGEWDRVLFTAGDRPNTDTLPALRDPASDHEGEELTRRRADIEEKHLRIRQFLDATGQDAVVLGLADSVAWFTSGGDLAQTLGSDQSSILLYISRTSRAVIADNVQSSRVFEEELAGLGFQLKEHPGTTSRTRCSPNCATTSGLRPIWGSRVIRTLGARVTGFSTCGGG